MAGLPQPPRPPPVSGGPRPPPVMGGPPRPPPVNFGMNEPARPQPPPSNMGGTATGEPGPSSNFGSGFGHFSVDSNQSDVVDKALTNERFAELEKRFRCLQIIIAVCLIITVSCLGLASFALLREPIVEERTTGGGTAAGASSTATAVVPGISTTAASAFTDTQWQAINTTVYHVINHTYGVTVVNGTDGPPGRDGVDGSCFGVQGKNETHVVGGYYGWTYQSGSLFVGRHPFANITAVMGDVIAFKGPHNYYLEGRENDIHDDVYTFENKTAWELCDFANTTSTKLLAYNTALRQPDGFLFHLYPQHVGKTLYFASGRNRFSSTIGNRYCNRGVKVSVHVLPRVDLTLRSAGSEAADSATVVQIRNTMSKLSRLAILTQLQLEQRIRSEGHSGLTDVRGNGQGIKDYNDGHFSRGAIASIHNHADLLRTVGIGEIQGVLNGVEFQTRHNDYALRMPSMTSRYHETVDIPFPDVPPEVTSKATVAEQVTEMQEWFRAFKNQDWSVRDYRNYFKPILCYLEGTWLKVTEDLTDPFLSERHTLDAKTWRELHDKMRFLSNSGRKNLNENIAFLPNAVRDMVNETWPVFANWEYRILCVPLKDDVPLQRFRVANDLSTQLRSSPITREELHTSRAARFEVNTKTNGNTPQYPTLNNGKQSTISWSDGPRSWDYLDYLMEQIPGKDNFIGNQTDTLANKESPAYHFYPNNGVLNAAYYSRYYSVLEDDAMGTAKHRRGFHDAYLWAAKTSQDSVSEVAYTEDFNVDPTCSGSSCATYDVTESGKWSYAIPMEIIFLTPLTKWNPYNVVERASTNDVTMGGRNGDCGTASKALNGWHTRKAFFTPGEFFGSGAEAGAGDTSGADTCVVDGAGTVRRMRASGHWIVFPSIGGGVGEVRQRYPIMPIHEMGSLSWKEVKALQELTLASNYDVINTGYFGDSRDERFGFTVEILGGSHQHFIRIRPSDLSGWRDGQGNYDTTGTLKITVDSDLRNGHEHTVELTRRLVNNVWEYEIVRCKPVGAADSAYVNGQCSDLHSVAIRST